MVEFSVLIFALIVYFLHKRRIAVLEDRIDKLEKAFDEMAYYITEY